MTTANTDNAAARSGFDSPVDARKDDHLTRWPLAREIYGIATTGPKDWSVRAGIYGEWGTGKTSVLKFIARLAKKHGHIVIWFDPWEHSNKSELWQAFVIAVYQTLEAKLGQVPGADDARLKSELGTMKKVIGSVLGAFDAGKAVNAGLDLLKKHFAFSQEDLASLQSILGDHRVIVLIDDLDRTAPELVPEILFALKELLDIPGFSFICAFDPAVVGKVLGRYHAGFGEGLQFLDKIIDYPRWLPPASTEGLVKLALEDAKVSCGYVPEQAICDAIPLLPANPRAVRQFIRLLALLEPQIKRHSDDELHWPVIIPANILKIRHPRIAHAVLNDTSFWDGIETMNMLGPGEDKQKKREDVVLEHVRKTEKSIGLNLDQSAREDVVAILKTICSRVQIFSGITPQGLAYQVRIAEDPAAVTSKEFDALFRLWDPIKDIGMIGTWIINHADIVERSHDEVYRDLLHASIRRYAQVLRQADNTFTEAESSVEVEKAESLFALLYCLVFDLGQLSHATKQIGDEELKIIVDKFMSFSDASMRVHADFRERNEAFLLKLVEQWAPDVLPIIRALHPYDDMHLRHFDGKSAVELFKNLCALALPNFARQVLTGFRQTGFVERIHSEQNGTLEARRMILDATGPFWEQLRTEGIHVFGEAGSNRAIQENAYELLRWFVLIHGEHAPGDPKSIGKLLSDQSLFDIIWKAATATTLSQRAVYRLSELPGIVQHLGGTCEVPPWWQQILATRIVPPPPVPESDGAAPATSAEDLS